MTIQTGFGGAVESVSMSTAEWSTRSASAKSFVDGAASVTVWCPLAGHVQVPVDFEDAALVVSAPAAEVPAQLHTPPRLQPRTLVAG